MLWKELPLDRDERPPSMSDPSSSSTSSAPLSPERLARQLTPFDAVMVGLGAMLGAGIFVVIGPAVDAAGSAVLLALLIAAGVAYCNALSSARLAARYPESGGTYIYGRRCIGPFWGYLAGWSFLVGKVASCAAMALTFAHYAAPERVRPVAIGAVLALTAINYFGVKKSALLTRLIVFVVLAALIIVVAAGLGGGEVDISRLDWGVDWRFHGVLQAAGLWFFAFAGYARLATLGEEVVEPERTIPRAIPLALGATLLVYLIITLTALSVVEKAVLVQAVAPLVAVVEAGSMTSWSPIVRLGATVGSLGVLLSLILGISRTLFAMAAERDMPAFFARVHPRYRVPHRAEVAVGAVVATMVLLVDVPAAIGFSAFSVLFYYAVTNAAVLRIPGKRGSFVALAGLLGCGALALSLPLESVLAGLVVLLIGAAVFVLRSRRGRAR